MAHATQLSLDTGPVKVDLNRLVTFEPAHTPGYWSVGGEGGRRSGEVGECLGVISLRHASGYEVVLQFPDGAIDTFAPMNLFPVVEGGQ